MDKDLSRSAILILDEVPKDCSHCSLMYDYECTYFCSPLNKSIENMHERDKDCPIIEPLPDCWLFYCDVSESWGGLISFLKLEPEEWSVQREKPAKVVSITTTATFCPQCNKPIEYPEERCKWCDQLLDWDDFE